LKSFQADDRLQQASKAIFATNFKRALAPDRENVAKMVLFAPLQGDIATIPGSWERYTPVLSFMKDGS
jgi:hypothetical protein